MSNIKTFFLTFVSFLLCLSLNAADFIDIDKPGTKKKTLFLTSINNSRANRVFVQNLKSTLDQSLLIEMANDDTVADYLLTTAGTPEDGQIGLNVTSVKEQNFSETIFGLKFRNTESDYVQLKAAQAANRILKVLFDIDGSFGSVITWSNVEASRKVIYRARFGLPTTTEQVSYNSYTNYGAEWSPDKKNIIFTAHTGQGTTILYQQINPLRLDSISVFPKVGVASSPSWSKDGTVFLSVHVSDQNSDIAQYSLEGNPYNSESQLNLVRKWTYDKTIETEPQISPDGKSLVYMSDETGSPNIFILNLENSQKKRLTTRGYNVTPVWSPNGKIIAYRKITNRISSIYKIDVTGGNEKRLTPLTLDAESPAWSPDGSLIAFAGKAVGEKSEIRKIYYTLSSGDGNEIRPLATPSSHKNQSNPSWGPALH